MGRVHVIEVSSYQIDLAPTLDPSVGILINVSEDHLDRHGTLARYAAVKERLVAGVQADGTPSSAWTTTGARPRPTASSAPASRWCASRCAGRSPTASMSRRADHAGRRRHRPIARAAWRDRLAARRAQCPERRLCRRRSGGAPPVGIGDQQGLASFPGLAHRMEQVGRQGRVLYQHSQATNADSAAQALACFSDIFWIAGASRRPAGFPRSPASSRASARPSDRRGGGPVRRRARADAARGRRHARAGGRARRPRRRGGGCGEPVVLLSPACVVRPILQFRVRGDAFRELVLALPGLEPV